MKIPGFPRNCSLAPLPLFVRCAVYSVPRAPARQMVVRNVLCLCREEIGASGTSPNLQPQCDSFVSPGCHSNYVVVGTRGTTKSPLGLGYSPKKVVSGHSFCVWFGWQKPDHRIPFTILLHRTRFSPHSPMIWQGAQAHSPNKILNAATYKPAATSQLNPPVKSKLQDPEIKPPTHALSPSGGSLFLPKSSCRQLLRHLGLGCPASVATTQASSTTHSSYSRAQVRVTREASVLSVLPTHKSPHGGKRQPARPKSRSTRRVPQREGVGHKPCSVWDGAATWPGMCVMARAVSPSACKTAPFPRPPCAVPTPFPKHFAPFLHCSSHPCPPSQTCQKMCTILKPFEKTGVPDVQQPFMTMSATFNYALCTISVPALSLRFFAPVLHRSERCYFASCPPPLPWSVPLVLLLPAAAPAQAPARVQVPAPARAHAARTLGSRGCTCTCGATKCPPPATRTVASCAARASRPSPSWRPAGDRLRVGGGGHGGPAVEGGGGGLVVANGRRDLLRGALGRGGGHGVPPPPTHPAQLLCMNHRTNG